MAQATHLRVASQFGSELCYPAAPPVRLRKRVARRLALTTSARSFREAQLKRVAALALKLEDQNSQWLEQAPAHVQRVLGAVGPKVFHVAAFISLLKDGQWPDADLLKGHLLDGFPLIGTIPVSHEAAPGTVREAVLSREQLLETGSQLRPQLLSRQSRRPVGPEAAADAEEIYRQTLLEIELGRMAALGTSASSHAVLSPDGSRSGK